MAITYTALTIDDELLTCGCDSLQAAFGLAQGDLEAGMVPVVIQVGDVRLDVEVIVCLLDHGMLAVQERGRVRVSRSLSVSLV